MSEDNEMENAPTAYERAGMAWWNACTEAQRAHWMREAGNTGRPADAWAAYLASREGEE